MPLILNFQIGFQDQVLKTSKGTFVQNSKGLKSP